MQWANDTERMMLPWHQDPWSRVMGQLHSDRMPHALLVTGLPGVGKRQFALRLAARLLCTTPNAHGACGACRSCLQFAAATHPDFHLVTLREDKKQIVIDQIRDELIDTLQLSAQYGDWKVAIIDPADQMNRSTFNALLKTLEEPSGKSLLMLVSARPARLAATVRSRCQRLRIPAPDAVTGSTWLAQSGVKDAAVALRLTGGAPLTALALQDSELLSARKELLQRTLSLSGGGGDVTAVAQTWASLPFAQGLDWLQTVVHDLIRLGQVGPTADLVNEDLRRDLQSGAHRLDWQSLHRHLDELVRLRALSEAPLVPLLQWESLMFAWSERLEPPPLY